MRSDSLDRWSGFFFGSFAAWFVLGVVLGGMYGCPKYNVWSQEMAGKARLAEAESSRRIAVLEARAKQDSAVALKAAEITRAQGAAESAKIIRASLTPEYLRYLWILGLQDSNGETVYIPTEAGLPVLEIGRRQQQRDPAEAVAPENRQEAHQ